MVARNSYSLSVSQRTISFINNSAGQEGAAIYATNLELCTSQEPIRLQQEEEAAALHYYENSIFAMDPFKFRYKTII